jgi:hypothetical protein
MHLFHLAANPGYAGVPGKAFMIMLSDTRL